MARKSAFPSPMAYWANASQIGLVMAEAQTVIVMRMMGMAGLWSVTPAEDARMVSEKLHAVTKAATDSTLVAMAGGSPEKIATAAIKPIRQKTRANVRRLGKRGPKKG